MSAQGSNEGFSYTTTSIGAIEASLSPERFKTYLNRAGGDRTKATRLYERNTYLSEALYGVTQAVEVTLRNSIHRILSSAYSSMWFERVKLEHPQTKMIDEARQRILDQRKGVTSGRVVAELNLGFWTALLAAKYEKEFWVPYLHGGFPNALTKKASPAGQTSLCKIDRAEIHKRLEELRWLRNRIAHHEPILQFDLSTKYAEAMLALHWMCPTTAKWVRYTNCFHKRFIQKLPETPPNNGIASATPAKAK